MCAPVVILALFTVVVQRMSGVTINKQRNLTVEKLEEIEIVTNVSLGHNSDYDLIRKGYHKLQNECTRQRWTQGVLAWKYNMQSKITDN